MDKTRAIYATRILSFLFFSHAVYFVLPIWDYFQYSVGQNIVSNKLFCGSWL